MDEQQPAALRADFLALEAALREEVQRPRAEPPSLRALWRWLTARLHLRG